MSTFCSLLLILLLPLLAISSLNSDTVENCHELFDEHACLSKFYAQCPTTCSTFLRPEFNLWGGKPKGASDFYEFNVKDVQLRTVPFEKYEGTLTLVLVLPKGADESFFKYHHNELLHLHRIYPWTLELVMISPGEFVVPNSAITVLLQDKVLPVTTYLANFIQKGKYDPENLNAFLLSPNGDELQMFIWPEILMLRQYIDAFLNDLEDEF